MKRNPILDGWRGIAILLVLIEHARLKQFVGEDGVAIFFVLSGYLITSRLIAERERTGQIDLSRFYIRRFFRLMPVAWLYLIVVAAMGRLRFPEAVACLLFYKQFFNAGPFSLTGHFWSLSCEEDFYLLWPGVLASAGMKRPRVAAVLSMALLIFGTFHFGISSIIAYIFICMPIGFGCAVAFLRPVRVRMHASLVMFFVLSLFGLIFTTHIRELYLVKCVIFAFLLWSTVQGICKPICVVLRSRFLTWLGTISYSLYVWHDLFLWLPLKENVWSALIMIAISLLVGYASYRLIETPMIDFGKRFLTSRTPTLSAQIEG